MGKLRCDPHEYHCPDQQSKSLKAMNKRALKKSVKITYISSPLLVRTCDASEFRSVVQQLTGKDSDNDLIISEIHPVRNNKVAPKSNWSNIIQVQDQPACRVLTQLQGGDDHHVLRATTTAAAATTVNIEEYGNHSSSSYYINNRALDYSLEFDEEDYLWKEVARSVLQSPCVLV